jgi:thioesterase domain-containing protein
LATLFEQSNIQRLAKVIENGVEPDRWRSLVPLRPGGSRKPLFLVHGLGLNVLLYTTIINYLDPEQPVYGLQAKGLNGIDQPLETIEEIAAYYISEIMTIDSEGPYQLAGYSLGGNIAYEMGIQLTRMGKQVSFIGLLDSEAQTSIDNLSINRKIGSIGRYLLNYLSWNITYFFKTSSESRFSVIKRRWRGLGKKVRGIDINVSKEIMISKGEKHELPKYLHKVHHANRRAGKKYITKAYNGCVHLFKANHQTFFIVDPVNYGWGPYALGGVVIHEIPGEHSSTFAPPNDKQFASKLQKSLDETMIQS